jgi:ornithine cyclodeaminase/alanine dehydrogenase-like protein (mu-crystallin family)
MTQTNLVQATVIGCGGMAHHHIRRMLLQSDTTHIAVVCEPSPDAYAATAEIFKKAGLAPPPNEPDLDRLLGERGASLAACRRGDLDCPNGRNAP